MRYSSGIELWGTAFTCACLLGCGDLDLALPDNKDAEQQDVSPDEEALAMIRKNEVAEARAWLADEKGHVVWKGNRDKIKQLVENLYAAGALKVYAAGISKEEATELVAEFMAELPTEANARSRIFQVQADFWKAYLDESNQEELDSLIEKDKGQKFLIFNFDL